jgi:NAD(P)-dependent dehydrogenase (short-subunit alcohol dehydrogenase family)
MMIIVNACSGYMEGAVIDGQPFTGQVCVITGGASGIGHASAQALARAGARVAVLDIDHDAGQILVGELRDAGSDAEFIPADMTNQTQVQDATRQILTHFGSVDAWVNVAGGSGRRYGDGPTHECSLEGWEYTLDLNLKTTFLGCKAALQAMLPQQRGAIVNISSVLGMVGGDEDFATHAYAASKGGIISLTRAIAMYYAASNIRANVVCPGLIATPMSRRAQSDEGIRRRLQHLQPLTGDFGQPTDVAQAVCFLASPQAAFITGAILPVDGGWTAQ